MEADTTPTTDVEVTDVSSAANHFTSLMEESETQTELPDEVEAEEGSDTDEGTTETEEVPESNEDKDVDEPPKETDEQITTFSELAEHLGVETDYLKTLRIPTKVDGKEGESTLEDLIASYQTQQHVTNKSKETSDLKRQLESQQSEMEQTFNQKLQDAAQLTQILEQQLMGELKDIDWNELRESDPGEYAAQKVRYSERTQEIQNLKQALSNNLQTATAEQSEKQLTEQREKLYGHIPEWTKDDVRKTESQEVAQYLRDSYGTTQEELDAMVDHRIVVLARKAMLFDKGKSNAKPKKAKLKTLPKVGTGRKTTTGDKRGAVRKSAEKRFKANPTTNNAAAIFKDMMLNTEV